MKLDKSDHRTLVLWATECAEHVLSYFEENYPNDNRPRKALEAGHAWVRGEVAVSEVRAAALAGCQLRCNRLHRRRCHRQGT